MSDLFAHKVTLKITCFLSLFQSFGAVNFSKQCCLPNKKTLQIKIFY